MYSNLMNNTATWSHGTSAERLEALCRSIAERKALADDFRHKALGNTVEGAADCLKNARQCEDIACGMERALGMLFP